MKPVLLSADCAMDVFVVPDAVAEDLRKYCLEFCKWLRESKHAARYRVLFDMSGHFGLCFNHMDFIEYLNTWIFPDQPSMLIGELDKLKGKDPRYEEYKNAPWFNF